MKAKSVISSTAVLLLICLFATNSYAQLFGRSGEDPEVKELKKLNTRIVDTVIPGMKKIMNNQADLSQRLDELKARLPGLRGMIEKNHSDIIRKIRAVDGKLANLETKLGKRISDGDKALSALLEKQNKEQGLGFGTLKMELSRFKKESIAQQDKFGAGLARDMEQFSKTNQDAFKVFAGKNSNDLRAIEKHLQTQNASINQNNDALTELGRLEISIGQTLASTLDAVQLGNSERRSGFTSLETNQKAVVAKNNQMIVLMGKSLKEQQAITSKVDGVLAGQKTTNDNINLTRNTITALKGIVDTRLGEINKAQKMSRAQADKAERSTDLIGSNLLVANTKMNKLAEGIKTLQGQNMTSASTMNSVQDKVAKMEVLNQQTHDKFNKLIDTTKAMLANFSSVDKNVEQSILKIDAGRTENNLASQKISKLITILKSIAAEQDKLQQVLASQKNITNGIGDLRRKANVNISRNDSILKSLGKIAPQRKASSKK